MQTIRRFLLAAGATTLLLGCGGDGQNPVGPPSRTVGMRIVGGATAADTIGAPLSQALTVEVRDSSGRLAAGTVVRFEALTRGLNTVGGFGALLTAVNQNQYTPFAAASTDASGRAAVLVQLGTVAGPARIAISVPTLGLADTVTYTVQPGAAAHLAPSFSDTGVVVGAKVSVGFTVVDRAGNSRTDQVTFDPPGDPTIATVSSSGLVTALAVGRTTITGHAGSATATTAIEVVPDAQIIVYSYATGQLGLVHLDGSGYTKIGAVVGYDGSAFTLRSDGSVVYSNGINLYSMSPSGTSTLIDPTGTPGASDETWPEYSPAAKATFYSAGMRLWKLGDDGTHTTIDAEPPGALEWRPAVSPDGTKVAYITVVNSAASIKVFDMVAGTTSTWSVQGQDPRWSPSGNQIVFTQQNYGPIRMMNADGSNVRALNTGTYLESKPDWSPDGKWIIAQETAGPIDLVDASTGVALRLAYLSQYSKPVWKH